MKISVYAAVAAVVLMTASCAGKYDDSLLQERLDKVEADVKATEAMLEAYKSRISSYMSFAEAYGKGAYVSGIEEITDDDGNVIGYRITFSGEGLDPIVMMNGKDGVPGVDGEDGYSPQLGIALHEGRYYWTVDGQLRNDLPASPDSDGLGVVPGETPVISIVDGNWVMTTSKGDEILGPVSGTDAVIGDDIFAEVSVEGDVLKVTFQDGETAEFPVAQDYGVTVDKADGAWTYKVSGYFVSPSLSVFCPYGWSASVEPEEGGMAGRISLTAPADAAAGEYVLNVLVTDGRHSTSAVFTVKVNEEGGLE